MTLKKSGILNTSAEHTAGLIFSYEYSLINREHFYSFAVINVIIFTHRRGNNNSSQLVNFSYMSHMSVFFDIFQSYLPSLTKLIYKSVSIFYQIMDILSILSNIFFN